MKQALITGGAGFIGSHLAEGLLARGYRVIALDDESTGSPENLQTIRDHFDFNYIKGSMTDVPRLRELLHDVDEVYHLAAAVGVRTIAESPVESINKNLEPTQLLLAELRRCVDERHPVKLFLASSSEVYGRNPKERWAETDEIVLGPTAQMRWSYGAAKALDEFLTLAYARQYNVPVVIGRFFNVVGPRQSGRYGMVLPRFVKAALADEPPVVYDDGQQVRCFIHAEDACRAVIELMTNPTALGQVVNIGNDEPVSIFELAERVVAAVNPTLDIEFESYRNAYVEDFEDVRVRVPDLGRLKSLIPFEIRYDLDAIIREVVDWERK